LLVKYYRVSCIKSDLDSSVPVKMVFVLIGLLAIIQSIFGVGILLFGTPLLLFFGYEFSETLLYLLPASAALSWVQVYDLRKTTDLCLRKADLVLNILPFVFVGLIFSVLLELKGIVGIFVFVMLLLTFLMRQFEKTKNLFEDFFRSNVKFSLALMGFIHGLSNMGGSLLTPIMTSLEPSKKKSLALVSFCYALMASFQLLFLSLSPVVALELKYFVSIPIVVLIKQTIGNSLLELTKERVYQELINVFIFLNAVIVAVKLF
jgi:uncharacterized protein